MLPALFGSRREVLVTRPSLLHLVGWGYRRLELPTNSRKPGAWSANGRFGSGCLQAARAGEKKGPGNPEPLLSTQPAPRQLFPRAVLRDLAPGWGHLGHEAFQRLEDLLGKFAVESGNLLRLRNKGLICLPCEFDLYHNRLIERPHTHELLDKGPGVME